MDLKKKIRNVIDFPKKGIVFRDITTLLSEDSYRLENPENFPKRSARLLMILNMERI